MLYTKSVSRPRKGLLIFCFIVPKWCPTLQSHAVTGCASLFAGFEKMPIPCGFAGHPYETTCRLVTSNLAILAIKNTFFLNHLIRYRLHFLKFALSGSPPSSSRRIPPVSCGLVDPTCHSNVAKRYKNMYQNDVTSYSFIRFQRILLLKRRKRSLKFASHQGAFDL